ncbi:alpha-L-fucosidase [Pseudoxanthomonas beigongshangi]|uniref:alpha-L-fucosidase n=1 Tax=Pseudoxanthomonas beigongshangi TaxID=2782537 RepID=UPI001F475905|nr:alpha-L-fucosidase [Pseudoxanthomonas beigongshangi]
MTMQWPRWTRRGFLGAGAAGMAGALVPLAAAGAATSARSAAVIVDAAPRPRPSAAQLAWQREELSMFVHFTVNTFTGREWGDGSESPAIFDPKALDARQWARTAKASGFRSMILTAKHHDGFCLWPTKTTTHSVASSPWRGGKGDLVREFTDACRAEGLGVGFYLSPWDRNARVYGEGKAYDDFYIQQLTELLIGYGPVVEVWFDGANGEGPSGKRQQYDWARIHRTVRELQPQAVMFSDAGPDVRWIGNETGSAGSTCWASVDPARVPRPGADDPWTGEALQQGDPYGAVWRPGETDVSIRPGWFWHADQDAKVRTPQNLMNLYFTSVGRNSKLLLNVPPTPDGLFHDNDVRALQGFARLREALLAKDLARGASAKASMGDGAARVVDGDADSFWTPGGDAREGWLELSLPPDAEFDVIRLEEAIAHGQHVSNYRIDVWRDDAWQPLTWGTTIGHCKLDRVPSTRTGRLRLVIEHAYAAPRIVRIGLHRSADAAWDRPDYHGD